MADMRKQVNTVGFMSPQKTVRNQRLKKFSSTSETDKANVQWRYGKKKINNELGQFIPSGG